MNKHPLRLALYAICTLIALVIIADFISPGKVFNEEVIELQRERQQYYNAGGNSHFSYEVITGNHQFSVEEKFAKSDLEDKRIEYSVSQIFREVNWYRVPPAENKPFYSFRIASGLVLPLLSIISILIAFRFRMKIDLPVFILQVLLIVDLIYLIN